MTGIPVAVGELVGVDYLNEVARALAHRRWCDVPRIGRVASSRKVIG